MNADLSVLSQRLAGVRERIAAAAERSGRAGDAVRLIAVTKTVPAVEVGAAISLGVADLGENRVQEAETKIAALTGASEGARPRWHLIGPLQRNKAGRAVVSFDRIHSLDRIELATAIARHATEVGRRMPVLIEVNVAGEDTKFGIAPGQVEAMVAAVAPLAGLELDGLMTIGPPATPEEARRHFSALRALRDRAERATGVKLPQLSMGMSADFEVAIEEGSTMVRLGTVLFGSRPVV